MTYSIGVLAGMGPRSTAPFIDMLVNASQYLYGAKHDMDFPKMHIISLPTPFYPGITIDDIQMIQALQSGIADLVNAKVDLIAVPCNLAHIYYSDMKNASAGIPILHIADCALQKITSDDTKIAIIGTEPAIDAGFYQERIHAAGKELILSTELRSRTTTLLALIKEKGFEDKDVIAAWDAVLSYVDALRVHVLLVACTDISPLIKSGATRSMKIVDTASSLAESAIHNFYKIHNFYNLERSPF
ncbi:aspartate/glutamate racemase family protein [Xenorhabdus szentirmaii]|uniref:aspartate/glutamate racemase family protein n=1 Tax=Xenorhabdus szentirmaii TaxID=290112 RepID=UPI0019BA45FD|nr:aspartate/glutamate racemase family protein [Xenorhabdus sp. CUL]MBD2791934.1 aspartate/glutamate racemase family protein [Xenorhabdus sp. CUL]